MLLRNILSILIPGALSYLVSLSLNMYTELYSYYSVIGILFFVALCFILNIIYALNAGSKAFTELLVAGIVIKLLLSLCVIAVYSFNDQAGLFNFSIHFMIYYILFTIFEIRYLLRIIKTTSSKTN
jgi:hypothetical protein